MFGSLKKTWINMIRIKIRSILVLPLALLACSKTPAPVEAEGNAASFSLSASVPETRVSFDTSGQLYWEGGESAGLIFGNSGSLNGEGRLTAELPEGDKHGVFAGEVDLGKFTVNDLRGVVCPYRNDHYYRRNGNSYRLVMTIGGRQDADNVWHQVQHKDNELNGDNIVLFSVLDPDDVVIEGGRYIVDGKQFQWGCSLIRFNIYGAGSELLADELFRSIELNVKSSSSIIGRQEWAIEQSSFVFNGVSNRVVTELEEPLTLAERTAESGIKVFMTLMSRNFTFTAGSAVIIHTDKADYTIPIETGLDLSVPGRVRRIGIDLGAVFPYMSPTEPNTLPEAAWIEEDVWTPVS